jgi:hypothetical protein
LGGDVFFGPYRVAFAEDVIFFFGPEVFSLGNGFPAGDHFSDYDFSVSVEIHELGVDMDGTPGPINFGQDGLFGVMGVDVP